LSYTDERDPEVQPSLKEMSEKAVQILKKGKVNVTVAMIAVCKSGVDFIKVGRTA
jgi:hypothetical protein